MKNTIRSHQIKQANEEKIKALKEVHGQNIHFWIVFYIDFCKIGWWLFEVAGVFGTHISVVICL